jgi:hypothetical protein
VEDLRNAIFERLKHSLQLLASPPDVQLRILPPYVCRADELALEFDHWWIVVLDNYKADLSLDQLSALTALHEKFDWLTADSKRHWTDEAIRTSPEWQSVRSLAISTLQAFNWPDETPPSYEHEYISPAQTQRHKDN